MNAEFETIFTGSNALSMELAARDGAWRIRLIGVINEDAKMWDVFDLLLSTRPVPRLIDFELGQVSRINSAGVREWILLIEQIPVRIALEFSQVAETIVDQANILPGIFARPNSRIVSFNTRYRCASCDRESLELIRVAELKGAKGAYRAPERKCQICSGVTEIDGIDGDGFYAFLRHHSPVP